MRKILAAAAAVLALLACGVGGGDPVDPPATRQIPVVFEVTGPASADITFGVGGSTEQRLGEALPFRIERSTREPVIAVIVAQSKGTGDIVCKLTIDGVAQEPKTSTGQFATVTCGGT